MLKAKWSKYYKNAQMKIKMFNWLKKKKSEEQGVVYSFVWYKKLESGNKTFYTQPFRTKVVANSFEEAKDKVTKFALGKHELVIVSENDFNKTDLSKFDAFFDNMRKQMDELFKTFH